MIRTVLLRLGALSSRLFIFLFFVTAVNCTAQTQTNPAGKVGYTNMVDVNGPCSSPGPGFDDQYSGWYFKDSSGTNHTFVGTSTAIGGKLCKNYPNPAETTGFTAISSDGIYSITTNGSAGVVTQVLVQGYIDPKYLILGVIYAPPGQAAGGAGPSNVTYSSMAATSKTSNISTSVAPSSTVSYTISSGFSIPFVGGGKITDTYSNTYGQTVTNSSGITLSRQITNTNTYYGTPTLNPSGLQAHDYDQIVLWLNPAVIFSINPNNSASFQCNGYGIDEGDPAGGMDIIPVYVGELNGDFVMNPSTQSYLNRSWASGQTYGGGTSAALTQTDYKAILMADPFDYIPGGTNNYSLGYPAPSTSADGRFTMSNTANGDVQTFDYTQAAPGQEPNAESYQAGYSQISTLGQSTEIISSVSTGVDVSFTGSTFLSGLSADMKSVYTLTTTDTASTSMTNTTSSAATAYIVGPPCGSSTSPCVPVYTGVGEFDIYQDNIYGTFMFYPIP